MIQHANTSERSNNVSEELTVRNQHIRGATQSIKTKSTDWANTKEKFSSCTEQIYKRSVMGQNESIFCM